MLSFQKESSLLLNGERQALIEKERERGREGGGGKNVSELERKGDKT